MELRKTEERINELIGLYESLRQSSVWSTIILLDDDNDGNEQRSTSSINDVLPAFPAFFDRPLPPLPPIPSPPADKNEDKHEAKDTKLSETKLSNDETSKTEDVITPQETTPPPFSFQITHLPDVSTSYEAVTRIQTTLPTLPIPNFRKRLSERDPVSHKPRYGEKTQRRVWQIVCAYDFLANIFLLSKDTTSPYLELQRLKERHLQQTEASQRSKEIQEQERRRQEQEAKQEALRQEQLRQADLRAAEERERQAKQAQEEEVRRQAEAARQRRLAVERAEQEWVNSIPKGPEGVKLQLKNIKEATSNDPEAQATAITSLHTIFRQINAHPEETNFRRIRRDHEKFTQDIGRHSGGVELLLAAGFELGAIDEVPCYISKEPNIELDMDGWSAWFDLLKATLEILEVEVAELSKKR